MNISRLNKHPRENCASNGIPASLITTHDDNHDGPPPENILRANWRGMSSWSMNRVQSKYACKVVETATGRRVKWLNRDKPNKIVLINWVYRLVGPLCVNLSKFRPIIVNRHRLDISSFAFCSKSKMHRWSAHPFVPWKNFRIGQSELSSFHVPLIVIVPNKSNKISSFSPSMKSFDRSWRKKKFLFRESILFQSWKKKVKQNLQKKKSKRFERYVRYAPFLRSRVNFPSSQILKS